MDQIDNRSVERFFSTVGAQIYQIAERTVSEEYMTEHIESGVLIGLSGGQDSVLLLYFLLEFRRRNSLDFTIACSHINHGIRGEEADSDEEFCKRLCNSLGVEFFSDKYSVPKIAIESGCSIEEAARNVRYSTFARIIQGRNDIGSIAVAHNLSDSAETVIFNILRGSGTRGASGISPVRDNIIRPLIRISKESIRSSLDEYGISYVTDSTNFSTDYTRNYIRHSVIPSLDKITSNPEKMIGRFADNARCDDDYISKRAEEFLNSHTVIRNSDLSSLHRAVLIRVISRMASDVGASVSHGIFSDICSNLSKDNFSYSLIGGVEFVCEKGICRISKNSGETGDCSFSVKEGINQLSPYNAVLVISRDKIDNSFLNVYKKSIQVNLSSAIIKGDLCFRSRRDGDKIYYGGMTRKLKKLFSDVKIPRSKRGLVPILCDDSGVLWVPGFGVRDDGVPKNNREDLFVLFATEGTEDENTDMRLYSASEFRT